MSKINSWLLWFNEIGIDDVPLVGGKNASLGEMYQHLTSQGVRVPNGFAITAKSYFALLESNNLTEKIRTTLGTIDKSKVETLQKAGAEIRRLISGATIPKDMAQQIVSAYAELGENVDVAVRSSATAEDLPDASFAGQQDTYLNVQGENALLASCLNCFASLYTDRAISYRNDHGFDHLSVGLSIGVQRMVRSDLATSGVMFSIDTETGFKDVVVINAAYGLGENVVQGAVNPDEFYIFKPTLLEGHRPILQRTLGSKEFKMIYDLGGAKMIKNIPVPPEDRNQFCIHDEDVLTLSRWACKIEDHYSQKRGHHSPMDMEWAKDGKTGELFIVQARPETVQSKKLGENVQKLESYKLNEKSKILLEGRSVGDKIVTGPVKVVKSAHDLNILKEGEILVTDKTDPDWEPAMKKAVGIITNRGGRTCHAAIVSRELGLPAVVGSTNATEILKDGEIVTLSCAEGETGRIYEGSLDFEKTTVDLKDITMPETNIMMNVGNPDQAFRFSFIPNCGVGLARMEFIISNMVKVHPMALIHFDSLEDENAKSKIEMLTKSYSSKEDYFVDRLGEGVSSIAAAFYPKDVIVRMSDFKTNEYADLLGGKQFEPLEDNPMLGFRGASRFYDPQYRDGFALECRAMKKVREEMGLTNVKLMIPFCRTLEEGRKVIAEMKKNGLEQGVNDLQVYVMCEIPSNVLLAEEFADIFDGFSIGSNDLTQLVLGVDRDSEMVAHDFDERNPAVKKMISNVIKVAKAKGKKIGICGQAPSDYPDFAQFLVDEGIDSISLNPDSVIKTIVSLNLP